MNAEQTRIGQIHITQTLDVNDIIKQGDTTVKFTVDIPITQLIRDQIFTMQLQTIKLQFLQEQGGDIGWNNAAFPLCWEVFSQNFGDMYRIDGKKSHIIGTLMKNFTTWQTRLFEYELQDFVVDTVPIGYQQVDIQLLPIWKDGQTKDLFNTLINSESNPNYYITLYINVFIQD